MVFGIFTIDPRNPEQRLAEAEIKVQAAKTALEDAQNNLRYAQNNLRISKTPFIWKNIFNTQHIRYAEFGDAHKDADKAGYPYVLWNDRIFDVFSGAELCNVENIGDN